MIASSGGHRGRLLVAGVAVAALLVTALVVIALPVGVTPAAAAPDVPVLSWVRSATAFDAASVGRGVSVDSLGNTIVTGSFENRATFGEGDRAVELISRGFEDIFVAKYDTNGELVWARSAGSISFDEGFAIDTDAAGNIYVGGEVWASALFGTVPLPAGAFLAKFAADGSLTWLRGESNLFGVGDLAVDSAGNAYMTGALSTTIEFGEGAAAVTLSGQSSAADVFLAAYEPDGDLAWARSAGGLGQDRGLGVDVNDTGNVVISGSFTGPTTFGTGPGAVVLPLGGNPDAFVAMYTANGNFVWVRAAESPFAQARDVAVDGLGRASIVGRFSDSVSFAAPGGAITLTAPEFTIGVFVATYAVDGTLAWAKGGTTVLGFPDGWSVAVDGTQVVIGGEFSGESITFGDGSEAITLDNVNSSPDVFVASFTSAGALSWARAAGGASNDRGFGVAIGPDSISFTGQYQFTATFGSGAEQVILGSAGSLAEPMFVGRYSTAGGDAPTRIVVPSRIARTGSATVRVVGAGLIAGTTFDLVGPGGEVLVPTLLTVKASGQEVEGRVELLDAALGPWTVRLTVPGEGTTLFPGAITVVQPGGNDEDPLWLSLSMRDTVRVGRPFVATLSVGNRTDRDLGAVPLVLEGLPAGTVVKPLWGDIERPTDPLPGLPPPAVRSDIPDTIEEDDGTLTLPILTGRIPANGRTDLPVEITFPRGTNVPANVTLGGCQPTWGPTGLNPSPTPGVNIKNCVQALLEEVLSEVLGFIPGASCVQAGFEAYTALGVAETGLDAVIKKALDSGKGSAMTGGEVIETIGDLIVSCALDLIPQTKLIGVLKDVWDLVQNLEDRIDTINACLPPLPPSTRRTTVVNSVDPNDKVGPDGAGVEGFTTPDVPFDYTIYFENVATATAAAQRVVITDVIDTSKFDPASIDLGAIIVGNKIVAVPPAGLRDWSGVAEIDDPDLLLGIDVSWNEATSTLTWTLDTLDRATQLPTDDPLAGFLPPNGEASEGEGSVRFLIEPRVRTDGTSLTNDATIVFDLNDPIGTGAWSNTLDGTAPTSAVAPLGQFVRSASIPLSWSATDAVSGIDLVEIWVQRDSGAPELWRIVTDPAVTTDTFVGADGSTYSFWTRAWDRAGNIEPPPGAPDAVTTIQANRAPTAIGQQLSTARATDLPVVLTGSDPDADALTFEVVTPPTHGSLLGTAPNLTYRPAAGFSGADSFTFRVSDGELASTVATIGIDVVPTTRADSVSLELFGPRRYVNAGDLLTGDLTIRVDRYGVAAVSGSGTLEGVNGGRAEVSLQIVRIGRTKLFTGSVRIDDPSVGPIRFMWSGALLGSATPAGPGKVEGIALASSSTRPFGPYVLRWSVTDAGP